MRMRPIALKSGSKGLLFLRGISLEDKIFKEQGAFM